MQIATIGPWQFEMPEGWKHKENESSESYFEEPGGEKGLYVKSILLAQPKASAQAVAEYIQGVQLRSYADTKDSQWKVLSDSSEEQEDLARSSLDLCDHTANYRVLSIVVCDRREAIQITVHDYWCTEYAAARNAFSALAASITKAGPAV